MVILKHLNSQTEEHRQKISESMKKLWQEKHEEMGKRFNTENYQKKRKRGVEEWKKETDKRNKEIYSLFKSGKTCKEIADLFYLQTAYIKQIIKREGNKINVKSTCPF
jgi:DNA-binding NarL/FixJ family response regulator